MTPTAPPLPPSGGYLEAIRYSSRQLRISAGIHITTPAIERFLQSPAFISSFKRVSTVHGLNLPLKFDSHLEELNLISVLSILNFASGYRASLHQQLGRGAWDSIRAFIFSLFITSSSGDDLLSASGMQSISMAQVAELMGVNLHVERPHETLPGVTVGELGGPLYELVMLITRVLNETGAILVNGGYINLGSFVLEALKEGAKTESSLETVLARLVKAFPAFQDMAIIEGQPIYCFKKALFLIHAIRIRFGSLSPPPFPIPETRDTPIFSDNVIPSLLIHLGVIDISKAPGLNTIFEGAGSEARLGTLLGLGPPRAGQAGSSTSKDGPVLSNDQAFKLRAAAIDACQMIVETARSFDVAQANAIDAESLNWIKDITLPELDLWICILLVHSGVIGISI
ncbi:hypothetical protein Agabi119p4_1829 [Agaricus bisporus var. burnettii]|uniref:Queuosine 5'-phosphate N-glycosylase/hydrolase n=1 Tax=Agaricus bisporus var. burnettii TaxID=192524 RepID=A0A8H7F836_AGABI|nr:hypothetical protein Agabi119p4_1829 [Agaricus bisporus var. burnettii]